METPGLDADTPWLAGCGIGDVTGEPWQVGLMGYGMRFQRSTGILLRQRSRAFVLVDRATGQRLVYVVADIAMFFRNVRDAVLAELDPSLYAEDNVVLTATHTHAGVAGYSGYKLYNMTTKGFRPRTFQAIVDGVLTSIRAAEADLGPARLVLARGELRDASVNRSPTAFARNPATDRAEFPAAIDPATTLLRIERGGRLVGAINWFATHGTSMTNRNTLISGDNKGYAAYHWERSGDPRFVAAFAQTNAGDMSPNVPDATHGPTDDEVENTRVIGTRQVDAAQALTGADTGAELGGGLQSRLADVNLARLDVAAEFTGDGRPHRTGRAVLGAAFAAGTKEGPGQKPFKEGAGANPLLSLCCSLSYRLRPSLGDAQRPKAMLIPTGRLGWTAAVLPVQLVRIGSLVLIAVAQEVTIVAGLRLRRAVADVLGVPVDDVLVQGYANDYAGYVTTPEEYDEQRYEGGHTMFGRWELAAYVQEVTRLATELRDGAPRSVRTERPPARRRAATSRGEIRCTGCATQPRDAYTRGDTVVAEFAVTGGEGTLQPTYCFVNDSDGDRVAEDGDWSTTVEWLQRDNQWLARCTWRMPADTAAGTYAVAYVDGAGTTVSSRQFTVAP
jgi:neutral ceramidase